MITPIPFQPQPVPGRGSALSARTPGLRGRADPGCGDAVRPGRNRSAARPRLRAGATGQGVSSLCWQRARYGSGAGDAGHRHPAGGRGGGRTLVFRQGSSQDLEPSLGPLRLVTIGRAFHWMDRAETARRLDVMLSPDGALVLFSTSHAKVPDNAWREEFDRVLDAALAGGQRGVWRAPGWVRNEGVLIDSPLSDLHQIGVLERRQTPGESLIDRVLSMSSSSRDRLGEAGEKQLRAGLEKMVADVSTDGMVTEVIESSALIARRP